MGKYFPHFVQLLGVSSVNNEVIARCDKLTGTSLPDSACCTDGESNVVGDCKIRQIERAYQGKLGVNAVSGRSLLY